jgi:hypothetical protein
MDPRLEDGELGVSVIQEHVQLLGKHAINRLPRKHQVLGDVRGNQAARQFFQPCGKLGSIRPKTPPILLKAAVDGSVFHRVSLGLDPLSNDFQRRLKSRCLL